MRNLAVFLVFVLVLSGCEDVVEISLPETRPRLVVEALIPVNTSLNTIPIEVKVSLTNSFFETIPVANLSQITLTNLGNGTDPDDSNSFVILIEQEEDSGIYRGEVGTEFLTDGELILQLRYQDRLYFSRTRYVPTVPIDSLVQGTNSFNDDDELEIIIHYTDKEDRKDFYLFNFGGNTFQTTEDTFYQGQSFSFSHFYENTIEPEQEIIIKIMGIDQAYYNFMNVVLEQSSGEFDIFETPVSTARGNIFDVTDIDNDDFFDNVNQPDNFPLGYFAIFQQYSERIIIE